jgi:hypothetical protein
MKFWKFLPGVSAAIISSFVVFSLVIGFSDQESEAMPIEFQYYELIFSPRDEHAESRAAASLEEREATRFMRCMDLEGGDSALSFNEARLSTKFDLDGYPLNNSTKCMRSAEAEKIAVLKAIQPYLKLASQEFDDVFGEEGYNSERKYVECMSASGITVKNFEINPSPDGKHLKIHHDCGAHTKVLREHAGRVAQIKFDAKNRKEVLDVIEQAIESSQ